MTREQQLDFLIYNMSSDQVIPSDPLDKWKLFRSLVNIRDPLPATEDFLRIQDALLQSELINKGITDLGDLSPIREDLYLWRGDITTLKVDAIVNAANNAMLGCFVPCHACIDNAIHTYAGIQLRLECAEMMRKQGQLELTGSAKITSAYNLPSKFILHTVGPIIRNNISDEDRQSLASCYRSCLELAEESGVESIAFCCISTGEYHFPNEDAAKVAIRTVCNYQKTSTHRVKVIFNVFTDRDEQVYKHLLRYYPPN